VTTWQPDLAPLADRIPRLHALLKAATDALTADLGVTPGMRLLMASLADGGAQTVPDLARERSFSRQHVQTMVNDLLAAGLAETRPNPAHRRSPLIALTDEGARRLRLIQERETQLLARAAPAVSQADIAAAMRLFDALEYDLGSGAVR
jgi:DNA-binding MarR family transcriptional regulator